MCWSFYSIIQYIFKLIVKRFFLITIRYLFSTYLRMKFRLFNIIMDHAKDTEIYYIWISIHVFTGNFVYK